MAKEKKQVKKKAQAPLKKKNTGASFNINALILAAVIAVITYISFSPSFKNDFNNWDDPTYVTENPIVQSDKTQWNEIFTKPVSLNYHPLTILTLAWNYQSADKEGGKVDATVFHEWNVWIHLLNTLLVFYFIWLLSGRQLLTAAFTAAVFGVHPMHVESVSWVSERKDVLYTLFFLLSCISYLHYTDKKKILYLALSFILFALSCLSKAVAVIIPLVFIAIDYFNYPKWEWRRLIEKIPFFLLSLYIGMKAYTIQATDAIAKKEVFTLFQRLMFGSYGAMIYLAKFFVPLHLTAFYPYPTTDSAGKVPLIFYISPLIWVALGLLVWYGLKKYRALSFGIVFFFITIVLVLQFLSVGSAIMAERYSYVPYIGIAFITGSLCNTLIKKYPSLVTGILVYSLCTAFVIFLSVRTYAQS
jgi:protein O-mannosyl-transferase